MPSARSVARAVPNMACPDVRRPFRKSSGVRLETTVTSWPSSSNPIPSCRPDWPAPTIRKLANVLAPFALRYHSPRNSIDLPVCGGTYRCPLSGVYPSCSNRATAGAFDTKIARPRSIGQAGSRTACAARLPGADDALPQSFAGGRTERGRRRSLYHARGRRCQRVATQSAVLPRSADDCLARTMRMPNGWTQAGEIGANQTRNRPPLLTRSHDPSVRDTQVMPNRDAQSLTTHNQRRYDSSRAHADARAIHDPCGGARSKSGTDPQRCAAVGTSRNRPALEAEEGGASRRGAGRWRNARDGAPPRSCTHSAIGKESVCHSDHRLCCRRSRACADGLGDEHQGYSSPATDRRRE